MKIYSAIILILLGCIHQGWTQAPNLQTIVANDPDDHDGFYSLGDVFTLTFDVATNQTPIGTKAQLDAIFTFSQSLGTNYTGVWLSPTVAEITVTDPTNHATPTIGVSTTTVIAASALMDVTATFSATAGVYGPITGDFGLGSNNPFSGGQDDGYADATFSATDTCIYYFGETGSGYAMAQFDGSCLSNIFQGDSLSGQDMAELIQGCPSNIFQGDSLSGYDETLIASTQNCLFFKGVEGSGHVEDVFINPYECTSFFAGAAGEDGAAQRSYTDDNGVCIILTFPVESSPLFAKVEEGKGKLYWWTYAELNNEGFELQKSYDGIVWKTIGWQAGLGTSYDVVPYEFWDENLAKGVQYYRYVQQDFDGKEFISNIVSLSYQMPATPDLEEEQIQLTLFPNPIQKGRKLSIKSWYEKELKTEVVILNTLGQELHRQSFLFSQDQSLLQLNTASLAQGTYIITIQNKNLGILKATKIVVIQ
ncbi:MAG: T9SS type A sorting domain-containing protein [Aureispira sp.]|nr:T9SS type A sorting domain-containing protein [Aureispira sp.]